MGRVLIGVTYLTCLSLFFFPFDSFGKQVKKVNIFSWWGYLSDSGIKKVENKCSVSLSVDQYYSNSEFLRRWDQNSDGYDLVIFSNTIYNAVKYKLKEKSHPGLINAPYHPFVMEKISALGFGKNTRLLALSFTGLLWNTQNLKIHDGLSLEAILDLAQNKIIVILDDAMEGLQILESLKFFQSPEDNVKKKAKLIIANDIDNLVQQPSFGFAYHWSGGAVKAIKDTPGKFDFIVHPDLSHVTADLISIMSQGPDVVCVFNSIAEQEFLDNLQKETFYFSPYGKPSDFSDSNFNKLYERYFLNLKKYSWLQQPEKEDFKVIDEKWKRLKAKLSN